MGLKLKSIFDEAKKIGDVKAQMRLTMITKMTAIKAAEEPDSPENVKLFENALNEIKKEFN